MRYINCFVILLENAIHSSIFAGFQQTNHCLKYLLTFQVRIFFKYLDEKEKVKHFIIDRENRRYVEAVLWQVTEISL